MPTFATGQAITTLEQVQYLFSAYRLLCAFNDKTLHLHSYSSSNHLVTEPTAISGCTLKMGHNDLLPTSMQHCSLAYFSHDVGAFDLGQFLWLVLEKGGSVDMKVVHRFRRVHVTVLGVVLCGQQGTFICGKCALEV
jgi:hypothetical protein